MHEKTSIRRVGVISDTHGLLRPEAVKALQGVDHLIHAGDVGDPEILDKLGTIAPVTAVRGNVDFGGWADRLPTTNVLRVGGFSFYVLHDLNELDLDPAVSSFAAVVSGHTHRPAIMEKDGVIYLNPGSAGPRRFDLPVTTAVVQVDEGTFRPELIHLDV